MRQDIREVNQRMRQEPLQVNAVLVLGLHVGRANVYIGPDEIDSVCFSRCKQFGSTHTPPNTASGGKQTSGGDKPNEEYSDVLVHRRVLHALLDFIAFNIKSES
jgi:hypothetical protein